MNKLQVEGQVASVCGNPRAFGRLLWDIWAQADCYDDDEFAATDSAFGDGAWPNLRVRTHRHRRDHAVSDPVCAAGEAALHPAPVQALHRLVLHGADQGLNDPDTAAIKEPLFCGGCERKVLQGGGDSAPRAALSLSLSLAFVLTLALGSADLHRVLACKLPASAP